jgi:hypothetical protein
VACLLKGGRRRFLQDAPRMRTHERDVYGKRATFTCPTCSSPSGSRCCPLARNISSRRPASADIGSTAGKTRASVGPRPGDRTGRRCGDRTPRRPPRLQPRSVVWEASPGSGGARSWGAAGEGWRHRSRRRSRLGPRDGAGGRRTVACRDWCRSCCCTGGQGGGGRSCWWCWGCCSCWCYSCWAPRRPWTTSRTSV